MKKLKQIAILGTILAGTWGAMAPVADAAELCGVTLGGVCPRVYRGCMRATGNERLCNARLRACERCTKAMAACRQKVGEIAGVTCKGCLCAYNTCRALNRLQ